MTHDPFDDSLVPLDVYLSNVYDPDCEYDDGFLGVRNMGYGEHEAIVEQIAPLFAASSKDKKLKLVVNRRLITGEHRYRVPDICLLAAADEPVLKQPPFAIIEILAPGESLPVLCAKTMEYLEINVAHVWIIDPQGHTAYSVSFEGLEEVEDGVLAVEGNLLQIQLNEIFQELRHLLGV